MRDWDIHDYRGQLRAAHRFIKRSRTSAKNKQLLQDFDRFCVLEGLSVARRAKLLRHLLMVATKLLPCDFRGATKADIQEAMVRLEAQELAPWTKHDVKVAIRKVYKWLAYGDAAPTTERWPDLVSWIKTTVKRKDRTNVEASHLLTVEEVHRMIEAERNPRNRALIALLYELGARIGELGHLRIAHVTKDEYSLLVALDGKTGKRTVRVVTFASHLVTWINLHPGRNDPDSPLWPSLRPSTYLKPLPYRELAAAVKRAARAAGIKKRVYPHLFRHSRYTHLVGAGTLNDAQAHVFFGWTSDSRSNAVYSHLVTGDANDAILKVHGIRKRNGVSREAVRCGMCETPNAPAAKFCYRCGYALSFKSGDDAEKRKDAAEDILTQFLTRPDVRALFKKMIREGKNSGDNRTAPPSQAPPESTPTEEEG